MTGDGYLHAAYSYLYIRDFEKAAEAFQHAIDCEPENPDYYFHASVTAVRNDCLELAKKWAKEAVQLAPDNALYQAHERVVDAAMLTQCAREAAAAGDVELATTLYTKALEMDPLNEEAECALSRLLPPSVVRVYPLFEERLE